MSGQPPLLEVSEAEIDDLRSRLRMTRWPTSWPVQPWAAGTDRPLTLAYELSDWPVGLLAWMLDKYSAWSDNRGDLTNSFSDDFLLTQAWLYWFTNTIGTSFRPYYEYGRGISHGLSRVTVPTAISLFPADISQPPRSWAERTHNVVHYARASSGGHFAPVEVPDLLADDIRRFVHSLL